MYVSEYDWSFDGNNLSCEGGNSESVETSTSSTNQTSGRRRLPDGRRNDGEGSNNPKTDREKFYDHCAANEGRKISETGLTLRKRKVYDNLNRIGAHVYRKYTGTFAGAAYGDSTINKPFLQRLNDLPKENYPLHWPTATEYSND